MMKTILVVEDNPADVFLIQQALSAAGVLADYTPHFAEDGEEALEKLEQLRAEGLQLVLLDLNLPKSGGLEVLQAIRRDPELARALVVTWTSSIAPQEVDRLMELGVNRHIVKPMRLEEYVQIGAMLRELLMQRQAMGA